MARRRGRASGRRTRRRGSRTPARAGAGRRPKPGRGPGAPTGPAGVVRHRGRGRQQDRRRRCHASGAPPDCRRPARRRDCRCPACPSGLSRPQAIRSSGRDAVEDVEIAAVRGDVESLAGGTRAGSALVPLGAGGHVRDAPASPSVEDRGRTGPRCRTARGTSSPGPGGALRRPPPPLEPGPGRLQRRSRRRSARPGCRSYAKARSAEGAAAPPPWRSVVDRVPRRPRRQLCPRHVQGPVAQEQLDAGQPGAQLPRRPGRLLSRRDRHRQGQGDLVDQGVVPLIGQVPRAGNGRDRTGRHRGSAPGPPQQARARPTTAKRPSRAAGRPPPGRSPGRTANPGPPPGPRRRPAPGPAGGRPGAAGGERRQQLRPRSLAAPSVPSSPSHGPKSPSSPSPEPEAPGTRRAGVRAGVGVGVGTGGARASGPGPRGEVAPPGDSASSGRPASSGGPSPGCGPGGASRSGSWPGSCSIRDSPFPMTFLS